MRVFFVRRREIAIEMLAPGFRDVRGRRVIIDFIEQPRIVVVTFEAPATPHLRHHRVAAEEPLRLRGDPRFELAGIASKSRKSSLVRISGIFLPLVLTFRDLRRERRHRRDCWVVDQRGAGYVQNFSLCFSGGASRSLAQIQKRATKIPILAISDCRRALRCPLDARKQFAAGNLERVNPSGCATVIS